MNDLERRLRAAMLAATEQAPASLMQEIRRRHRRHVRRVGAGCVAAVAAIAIATPAITHALRAGTAAASPSPVGPAAPAATSPTPTPTAAPGTALRTCHTANNGTLNTNWQAQSLYAGSIWFIGAREKGYWRPSRHSRSGQLEPAAAFVGIRNGATVVLTAAPSAGAHMTFLPEFQLPAQFETARNEASGITFVACPAGPTGTGIPESYAPGLTLFSFEYATSLTHCLPLDVQASGGQAPGGRAPGGRAPGGPTSGGPASGGPASSGSASGGPASGGPASGGGPPVRVSLSADGGTCAS